MSDPLPVRNRSGRPCPLLKRRGSLARQQPPPITAALIEQSRREGYNGKPGKDLL
jgi:hypothetical protein